MGHGRTWPTKKPWVALRWIAISHWFHMVENVLSLTMKLRSLCAPFRLIQATHTLVANKDQVMTPLHFQGSKFLRSQCNTNSNEENPKRCQFKWTKYEEHMIIFNHEKHVESIWEHDHIQPLKNRWVNMRTWSYSTIKHKSFGNSLETGETVHPYF